MRIAIKETFYSLRDESVQAGRPAVFWRVNGCNLKANRRRRMSPQAHTSPGIR